MFPCFTIQPQHAISYYATVLHHSSNIAYHATRLSYCCTFNLVMGLIKTQNSYILLTPRSTLWCPSMYLILLLIVVTGSEPVITTAGHLTLMSGWHSVLINQIRLVQEMPLFSGYCQHACRRKFKGKWSKKNKLDRKGGTEREREPAERHHETVGEIQREPHQQRKQWQKHRDETPPIKPPVASKTDQTKSPEFLLCSHWALPTWKPPLPAPW